VTTDGADVAVLTVASAVEKAVLEPNSCHETFNPYNSSTFVAT